MIAHFLIIKGGLQNWVKLDLGIIEKEQIRVIFAKIKKKLPKADSESKMKTTSEIQFFKKCGKNLG